MRDIPLIDVIAVIWFVACWAGYSMVADTLTRHNGNLLVVMNEYRREWMRQMMRRDNRMVDAALIGNLLRSISFFASTSIFIVLGLFTMLKYRDEASDILMTIPFAVRSSPLLWETKIFLIVITFGYTFFKYTWSLRQYNYACVVVGAAPPSSERNIHFEEYAQNAARLVANAARHFNMGLRGYYFGIAAFGWFINPWAFIGATAWVLVVVYRREFRSHALKFLVNPAVFRATDE